VESPICKNSALVAGLADAAEEICAAADLTATAAAVMRCLTRLLACSAVSFSVFDLRTLDLFLDEHQGALRSCHKAPRLERSGNLAASLEAGAQLLTLADEGGREYFVLYENRTPGRCPECELRIPFFRDPATLCVITLGKKESGMDYSSDEIDALRVLIAMLSSSSPSPAPAGGPCEGIPDALASYQRRGSSACLLGSSRQILAIKEKIACIAPTDASVLITGESGTGKELVARAVHENSARRNMPFLVINCGGIPENLLESELFGYIKGSFTGAYSDKAGLFEFAQGGTVFLDEIAELPPLLQVKLLRVVQEKTFRRIGGSDDILVDVRIISATHRNLEDAVKTGSFREDLYYRLNVIPIQLPPLRERKEDIPILTNHFIEKYSLAFGKEIRNISVYALELLMRYPFPGNIRELENIIERSIAMETTNIILPENLILSRNEKGNRARINTEFPEGGINLNEELTKLEKDYLEKALEKAGGSKSKAAELLRISYDSFHYRCEKLGIDS